MPIVGCLTGSLQRKRSFESPEHHRVASDNEQDDHREKKAKSSSETKSPNQYRWKKKISGKGNDSKQIQNIREKLEATTNHVTPHIFLLTRTCCIICLY